MSIKRLVEAMTPLHRTLVSDGTDEVLEVLIREEWPEEVDYWTEVYPSGEAAWTWKVPERFVVHEAFIESADGERFVDFRDHPLHLVSYSLPIDREMSWDELEPHLYYSTSRPKAIPWVFRFYERDWGFCLSYDLFQRLPRDKRYRVVIRTDFQTGSGIGLRVGVGLIRPAGWSEENGEVLVLSHVCHPGQSNDDAAGVATAVEVARRLVKKPVLNGRMGVRFLFVPETIGTICYVSRHEDLIPLWRGGIFVESTGNRNSLALQHSWQHEALIDQVALGVAQRSCGPSLRRGRFFEVVANDEVVVNGPGVGVPCVSFSRVPYDEYHTSDDNPDIIHEDMLTGAADVVEETLRIFCSNYIPRRTFTGPVFLTRYGLWVDYRKERQLSGALEEIMFRLDGDMSVHDIARDVGLDYWVVFGYLEKYHSFGLIEKESLPPRFYPPPERPLVTRRDMTRPW